MEIKWKRTSYEVDEWFIEPDISRTLGVLQQAFDPVYSLRISSYNHKEPDKYNLSISVLMQTKTEYEVCSFSAKTTSIYKIPIDKNKTPLVEFIFLFFEKAGGDFFLEFENRKAQTVNQNRKIPIPLIESHRQDIQLYIDRWDRDLRYTALN